VMWLQAKPNHHIRNQEHLCRHDSVMT